MGGKRTTEYNRVVLLRRPILLVIYILSEKKAKEGKNKLISMHSFVMQTHQLWEKEYENDLLGKQCDAVDLGPYIPISIACFCLKYTLFVLKLIIVYFFAATKDQRMKIIKSAYDAPI